MIDRYRPSASVRSVLSHAAATLVLAACADGTLPARTADDPANPSAAETPFSVAGPAPSAAPPPSMPDMPGMPGMDHSHMQKPVPMPSASASPGKP